MIPLTDKILETWIVLTGDRGYAGNNGLQIDQKFDQRFGEYSWSKAHNYDDKLFSKEKIIKIYEEGYFQFLKNNPDVLEWLVSTASEVYDIDPSNVNSSLDYSVQECSATHLQDIAVRNVLDRLGRVFEGDHLVQIRGHESEGYVLNPGQVPFHRPDLIIPTETKSWWKPDSVEAFYQHNKVLLVDPERLLVTPDVSCPDGNTIFKYTKSISYWPEEPGSRFLRRIKGKDGRRLTHEGKGFSQLRLTSTRPYSEFLK
jgi:hypothetical protein